MNGFAIERTDGESLLLTEWQRRQLVQALEREAGRLLHDAGYFEETSLERWADDLAGAYRDGSFFLRSAAAFLKDE